jgi:hypothetical protein
MALSQRQTNVGQTERSDAVRTFTILNSGDRGTLMKLQLALHLNRRIVVSQKDPPVHENQLFIRI